jgi:hypothetical protein
MSADGEDRFGQSFGQIGFQWRDAAPQPDRARLAVDDAHNGIVCRAYDGSIVMQKRVGYRSETCFRFCVIGQHRFVRTSMIFCSSLLILSRPSSMSGSMVLPMTSRSAVCEAQLMR